MPKSSLQETYASAYCISTLNLRSCPTIIFLYLIQLSTEYQPLINGKVLNDLMDLFKIISYLNVKELTFLSLYTFSAYVSTLCIVGIFLII